MCFCVCVCLVLKIGHSGSSLVGKFVTTDSLFMPIFKSQRI